MTTYSFIDDKRFRGIEPFADRLWLASPTMHGEELTYIKEAYETNWMSTVGENINKLEQTASEYIGVGHAVALSCGTAALHLAVKLASEQLYGSSSGISTPQGLGKGGCLYGKRIFCSDLTFDATVNPVLYEGGEPVFIDVSPEDWNMDPEALEMAFQHYPDVKLVIFAHLYGVPAQADEIKNICRGHGALLIEDAAESLGALYKGRQTGSRGDYGVISFNGNKIITGSSGGMLLVNDRYSAEKARKWSTQSREDAPWYQHEELGYNYRMSNVIAGVIRGQWEHLEEHIEAKKNIYRRYERALEGLGIQMNPYDDRNCEPNFWLSCILLDENYMCEMLRSDTEYQYRGGHGRTCPMEIYDALAAFHIESRPICKPLHKQPIYRNHEFVTAEGCRRYNSSLFYKKIVPADTSADIFCRGLCLPSDIKMTEAEQDTVIEIVRRCLE
ncbi:MAG: aminotransferase DegT [Lachnospiraceae bacterium]|nr:aminotransferase DegT [Lachnospiraceae bacterium]